MKLVLVKWVDSHGCTPQWQDLTDYETELPIMKSVGWVIFENDKLLSVCGHIAEVTDSTPFQGNGIMTIPKQALVSVRELSV